MDEDLRTRLLDDALVRAIAKKVAWVTRPAASDLPAVTLQRVSPGRSYTMKGAVSLQDTRVQFDFWALKLRDAKALARAATALLERPAIVGETSFGMSFLDSESDMPPEDVPGIGLVHRVRSDFIIWWKPA